MATPAKRTSAARGKASPEAAPSLRFHYDPELHARVLAVLEALEQAADPGEHREALGDVVVELTNAGLGAYFLDPLEAAEAGFLARRSAGLGIAGAQKVMGSVIRSIIGRMDPPQVLSVCASIRAFMR
jgi:hypothetical protein